MRIIINIKQRTNLRPPQFIVKMDSGVKDSVAEMNLGKTLCEELTETFKHAMEKVNETGK